MDQRSFLSGEVRPARLQSRHQRRHLRDESLICLRSKSVCASITSSIDLTPPNEIHWTIDATSNSFRYAKEKSCVFETSRPAPFSVRRISNCSSQFHFATYARRSVS